MTVVVVVIPLVLILCKLCMEVTRHEKELKEVREELNQVQQGRSGGNIAYAQGGYVNVAIGSCFNVYCTFYITLVVSSTALAFVTVIAFICYVLYTYHTSK